MTAVVRPPDSAARLAIAFAVHSQLLQNAHTPKSMADSPKGTRINASPGAQSDQPQAGEPPGMESPRNENGSMTIWRSWGLSGRPRCSSARAVKCTCGKANYPRGDWL